MPPRTSCASYLYAKGLIDRGYGLPLWSPEPESEGEIQIGDVGFIHDGKFIRLFNASRSPHDPLNFRGVPDNFVKVEVGHVDTRPHHISMGPLCTTSLAVQETSASLGASKAGHGVDLSMLFDCSGKSGAAAVLGDSAILEEVVRSASFPPYMVTHYVSWHAFASKHGFSLQPEDIVLVYGHVKTSKWALAVFNSKKSKSSIFFSVCAGNFASAKFKTTNQSSATVSVEQRSGPPSPETDRRDQCIFIKYYKLKSRRHNTEVQTRQRMQAEDVWRAELVHKYRNFLQRPRLPKPDSAAEATQGSTITDHETCQTNEGDAELLSMVPSSSPVEEPSLNDMSHSDDASIDSAQCRSDPSPEPRATPMPDRQADSGPGACICKGADKIVENWEPWEQEPEGHTDDDLEQGGVEDDTNEAQDRFSDETSFAGPDFVEDLDGEDSNASECDSDSTYSYCSDASDDEDDEDEDEDEKDEADGDEEETTDPLDGILDYRLYMDPWAGVVVTSHDDLYSFSPTSFSPGDIFAYLMEHRLHVGSSFAVQREFTMHSTHSYHDFTIRNGEAGCDPPSAMLPPKSHSCDCFELLETSQTPFSTPEPEIPRRRAKQVLSPLVIKSSPAIVRSPSSTSGPFSTPHLERYYSFNLPARQKHPVIKEKGAIPPLGSSPPPSKTNPNYHGHLLGSGTGPAIPTHFRGITERTPDSCIIA